MHSKPVDCLCELRKGINFHMLQRSKGGRHIRQRMKPCYFKGGKNEYSIKGKIFQICKEKYFSLEKFPHALIFVWLSLPVAFQAICLLAPQL